MDISQVVQEKIKLAEETLNTKLGGTWKIDEMALLGQCRAVNEKNESIGPVSMEFGVLKITETDMALLTPVDQAELAKRMAPKPALVPVAKAPAPAPAEAASAPTAAEPAKL